MIPVVGAAVATTIAKVTNELVDVSADFSALSKDEKNQAVALLYKQGISQKQIAESFGISAPAVSQRLKKISSNTDSFHEDVVTQTFSHILKLIELANAGFSKRAITALLMESGLDINENDVDSFFKICTALNSKLRTNPECVK